MALRFDTLASLPKSETRIDGTVAVILPYDDRYDGEISGETKTATLTYAFVGFGYGTHRGNYVTGDSRFATYPGPFGSETIGQSVGNLLLMSFQRAELAESVVASTGPVRWACAEGTCIPNRRDILKVAAASGARVVVAPRLGHFFGSQFGEQTVWAASYQETRGQYVYQVTESYSEKTSAGAAGSAVVELTIFEVSGGAVANTTRLSVVGTSAGSAGNDKRGKEATARIAAQALQNLAEEAAPATARALSMLAGEPELFPTDPLEPTDSTTEKSAIEDIERR